MMPIALEHGIGIREFETLTFKEVSMIVEVENKKKKERLKERLFFGHQMVDLMAASVGRLYDSNIEYPAISAIYPDLFEDVAQIQEQQRLAREQEMISAQWKAFAAQHNNSRKTEV